MKGWNDLSTATKAAIIGTGTADAALRVWALIDIARRPDQKIKGSKPAWATALSVVSSAGILPAIYLGWARLR